jgi:hypothetical protein
MENDNRMSELLADILIEQKEMRVGQQHIVSAIEKPA